MSENEPAGGRAAAEPEGSPQGVAETGAGSGDSEARAPGGGQGRRRRRGSRGGAQRQSTAGDAGSGDRTPDEMPDKHKENRATPEAAERALVRRRPQIGDTMPDPSSREGDEDSEGSVSAADGPGSGSAAKRRRRRRGGRGRPGGGGGGGGGRAAGSGRPPKPVTSVTPESALDIDDDVLEKRKGRERKGRAVGRYMMVVHAEAEAAQIGVLEGRSLIEYYLSRPSDNIGQIHGNVYLARVQNVLPGMEAAFVDIGTPKNAVLYRSDTRYDAEDLDKIDEPRIEQILKNRQVILCQVTKNPIAHKGARLTQEVSLPGRFVVLVPNSTTYGISKRLPDDERKRLRSILDRVKPAEHGVIVRTAAENITGPEIERDVARLVTQWTEIEALAAKSQAPTLLYQEPDMAVRVIREEFTKEYRQVVIDDPAIYREVRDYVAAVSPALADRVEHYDPAREPLPLLERFHVHEQLHKALDRKVWLPSGGSLIIEHTEALTVIDVNTGKNVGSSSLEETVYRNNLEAAEEIARQLRLRDVGGIIVIDFVDMEVKRNRADVIGTFRSALARDKTRTQVFDISELGLVEMTRKRIGEGLLESFSEPCPACEGRGIQIDHAMLATDPEEPSTVGDGAG